MGSAVYYGGVVEPNKVHVAGDINIGVGVNDEKWLQADYPHLALSRIDVMLLNFKGIPRIQFNSVTGFTETSWLDHIYTNAKFRCSDPKIAKLQLG